MTNRIQKTLQEAYHQNHTSKDDLLYRLGFRFEANARELKRMQEFQNLCQPDLEQNETWKKQREIFGSFSDCLNNYEMGHPLIELFLDVAEELKFSEKEKAELLQVASELPSLQANSISDVEKWLAQDSFYDHFSRLCEALKTGSLSKDAQEAFADIQLYVQRLQRSLHVQHPEIELIPH